MTLQEILIDTAAYLDQTTDLPTGDDYNTRVNFANQAIVTWQKAYRWNELKAKYVFTASTMATISLPSDLDVMAGNPQELMQNSVWREHIQVDPKMAYSPNPQAYICWQLGNDRSGFNLIFNNLASGATIALDYYKTAATLATLTDKVEMMDGSYVSDYVISKVLEARGDDRFPIVSSRAQQKLVGMIGDNQSGANSVTRAPKYRYRLGRR